MDRPPQPLTETPYPAAAPAAYAPGSETLPVYGQVWPPPPGGDATEPQWFPFRFLFMRVKGNIADFRQGAIGVSPVGMIVSGKAVPRSEVSQPILIAALVVGGIPGYLIASAVINYAMLNAHMLQLPWSAVQSVVFVPDKSRACIVYDALNYSGRIKRYSLAFRLPPETYAAFRDVVTQYGGERAVEGKLVSGNIVGYWLLGILGTLILIGLFFAHHS